MKPAPKILIAASLLWQLMLVTSFGCVCLNQVHSDTISYVRIASYYADGKFDLAISGYWGPLLSWITAPLLSHFDHPLAAARVAVGLSSFIFTAGCLAVYQRLQLPVAGRVLASWVTASAAALYSIFFGITPDLLMAGFVCLAISLLLSPQWPQGITAPFASGLLFGTAYLSKAAALPMAIAIVAFIACLWWITSQATARCIIRAWTLTMAGLAFLALPWVIALSVKYGRPTFSTTAGIAYAIVGPQSDNTHAIENGFTVPEAGRITTWEDPDARHYVYWSPLANAQYFRHQLKVIVANLKALTECFRVFDSMSMGPFAVALGLLIHAPWRRNMAQERWRWGGVPVVLASLLFVPIRCEARYLFVAYPFLLGMTMQVILSATSQPNRIISAGRAIGLGLLLASFGAPIGYYANAIMRMESRNDWWDWAMKFRTYGIRGPVAGDDFLGLYVCFANEQQFYGMARHGTADDYVNSGAKVFIMRRESAVAQALDKRGDCVVMPELEFTDKDNVVHRVYVVQNR